MRRLGSLTFLALVLWACDDGGNHGATQGEESSAQGDGDRGATGESEGDFTGSAGDITGNGLPLDPLTPFSRELPGFVENTAVWQPFLVTVEAARVERGMGDPWWDSWEEASIPKRTTYAELELSIENPTRFDKSLAHGSKWDLILADETRLSTYTRGVSVALGVFETASLVLRYGADAALDLRGACLELNGQTRGEYHSLRIPLDRAYTPDIDYALPGLASRVFESTRPDDFNRTRIELLGGRVTRDSAELGRAHYGKKFLRFDLYVTTLARSDNIQNYDFELTADGSLVTPANHVNFIAEPGMRYETSVIYELDEGVRAVTAHFHVGKDSDSVPEQEWQSLSLTL